MALALFGVSYNLKGLSSNFMIVLMIFRSQMKEKKGKGLYWRQSI